jgi:hypothetical protein
LDLLVSRPHTPLKLFPDDHTLWAPRQQQQQQQQRRIAAAAAAGSSSSRPSSAAAKGGVKAKPNKAPSADAAPVIELAPDTAAAGEAAGDVSSSKAADSAAAAAAAAAAPKYDTSTLAAPFHPHHRRDAYQRLRELVYASPYIDPDYVLAKLNKVGLDSCQT